MKHAWFFYPCTFIFLTVFCFLLLYIYQPIAHSDFEKITFNSPLPPYLDMTKNDQVTQLDFWVPAESIRNSNVPKPSTTASSALTYDLTTNQFIYEKNIKDKRAMASLTKIMTAIVALEHPKVDNNYVVDQKNLVGEDSMGLSTGEILSLKELLYGLILRSGNDAAEVIATNSPWGRNAFVNEMNRKILTLGLRDTNFTNPTGLEGDGNQYTTAYDLLVMTRYALVHFSLFDEIAAAISYTIPQTSHHKEYDLQNETNLIATYPGMKGVKTGYTPTAGWCLVSYLEYGNHKIIGVILNSQNRRDEMKEIMNYSLVSLGITPPVVN